MMPQILTSVWARNITRSSVTIRWRIRYQGQYVISQVSLKLRQLSSSTWQYDVKELPEDTTHYNFPHLKPGAPYLLRIVAVNSRGQQDAETLMFWTARVNSTGICFHNYRAFNTEKIYFQPPPPPRMRVSCKYMISSIICKLKNTSASPS